MSIAQSKLTAQGQISVPASVRRRLGVGPGETIEWAEQDGLIVVRRASKYSSRDIHDALFPDPPGKAASLSELKDGIRRHTRRRHARR